MSLKMSSVAPGSPTTVPYPEAIVTTEISTTEDSEAIEVTLKSSESTVSIHEMAIDVPELPEVLETSKEAEVSKTNGDSQITKNDSSKTDDIKKWEKYLSKKCCFGYMNVYTCAQYLAVANFLADGLIGWLTHGTHAPYLCGMSAIVSLISLCSVISGIQDENIHRLDNTIIWTCIKLLCIIALHITGVLFTVESYFTHGFVRLEIILEYCLLPFFLASHFLQWKFTAQVITIIEINNDIYSIPSSRGSVLRASFQQYLTDQKSKNSK